MHAITNARHVRILSDLHLGHKLSRVEDVRSLRPLVEGVDVVVFNGDTWQELARAFRPHAETQLRALKALCAEVGAFPVFLSGNHDPGWQGDGWLALADGKLIVTHGDALLPSGSPWKREIMANPGRVEAIWSQHPNAGTEPAERIRLARAIASELRTTEHTTGRSFLMRAWDAAVPPGRALRMIDAWLRQGTEGARFCERYFPNAEVLVIGHFHRAGCWRRGDRIVLNTGAFVSPGRACVVDWFPEERRLSWADVDECDPRAFRVGRAREHWRL
ncbi:MAG: metallophosphoesterase [Luteolibacter sp.]